MYPPDYRTETRDVLQNFFVGAAGDGSLNIPERVPWWAANSAYVTCRGQVRLSWHRNLLVFRPVTKDRGTKLATRDPTLDTALKQRVGDGSMWGKFEGTVGDA